MILVISLILAPLCFFLFFWSVEAWTCWYTVQSLFSAFLNTKKFSVRPLSQSNGVSFFIRLLSVSCLSNYCAWSSRHRFDGKLNSVFSEQTDGALLQRDLLIKVSEGPVSVKRTWPLSCISMFAGAYKGVEKKVSTTSVYLSTFFVFKCSCGEY